MNSQEEQTEMLKFYWTNMETLTSYNGNRKNYIITHTFNSYQSKYSIYICKAWMNFLDLRRNYAWSFSSKACLECQRTHTCGFEYYLTFQDLSKTLKACGAIFLSLQHI